MANTTEYMEEVRERVLFLLASEPLTSRELEARLGYSYPTIRRAVTELLETGEVAKFDRRARNAKYTIGVGGQAVVTSKIPSITFKGNRIKLSNVYLDQGLEDIGNSAVLSILKAWTTIATTARRLDEGMPSKVLIGKLNRSKVDLANARMNLEHLVFLINQIIDNQHLWEPEHLANFSDDPEWESFLPHLEELYSKFYGSEE